MLTDDPKIRRTAYYAIASLGVVAIALKHINAGWAESAADAVTEVIVYLSTIFGIVAGGNVPKQ